MSLVYTNECAHCGAEFHTTRKSVTICTQCGMELAGAVAIEVKKTIDLVNHPAHYTAGKIEVIDFIEDQKLGFHLANAIKYICRCGRKDGVDPAVDCAKAIWYIERYVSTLKDKKM